MNAHRQHTDARDMGRSSRRETIQGYALAICIGAALGIFLTFSI